MQNDAFTEKNYAIEFYRFLFCCIVIFLHFRYNFGFELFGDVGMFSGGYLGVEFFFITSGCLMMRNMEYSPMLAHVSAKNSVETETRYFFAKRFQRLMPLYWVALVLLFVEKTYFGIIVDLKKTLLSAFPEFLGMNLFWAPTQINGPAWYISAMLWMQPLVYYLLRKQRDIYLTLVAPASVFLFIHLSWNHLGHIDVSMSNPVYAFLRAFAEIGLGCLVYCAVTYVRKNYILNTAAVTVAETVLIVVILAIMYRTRRDYKDYMMIFLIAGLVFLILLNQGFLTKLLNRRAFQKLGRLSYPMYLNQAFLMDCINGLIPQQPFWNKAAIMFVSSIIFAWVELFVCKAVAGLCTPLWHYVIQKRED